MKYLLSTAVAAMSTNVCAMKHPKFRGAHDTEFPRHEQFVERNNHHDSYEPMEAHKGSFIGPWTDEDEINNSDKLGQLGGGQLSQDLEKLMENDEFMNTMKQIIEEPAMKKVLQHMADGIFGDQTAAKSHHNGLRGESFDLDRFN